MKVVLELDLNDKIDRSIFDYASGQFREKNEKENVTTVVDDKSIVDSPIPVITGTKVGDQDRVAMLKLKRELQENKNKSGKTVNDTISEPEDDTSKPDDWFISMSESERDSMTPRFTVEDLSLHYSITIAQAIRFVQGKYIGCQPMLSPRRVTDVGKTKYYQDPAMDKKMSDAMMQMNNCNRVSAPNWR